MLGKVVEVASPEVVVSTLLITPFSDVLVFGLHEYISYIGDWQDYLGPRLSKCFFFNNCILFKQK